MRILQSYFSTSALAAFGTAPSAKLEPLTVYSAQAPNLAPESEGDIPLFDTFKHLTTLARV